MKSTSSIWKEIEKEKYKKSPIGLLEKEMTDIYNELEKFGVKPPKELIEKINKIRTDNEQWQLDYIDRTNKEHKEAVDAKLIEAMSEELELLKLFKKSQ